MAHLDMIETGGDANLAALFWWRRETASESPTVSSLTQRLMTLGERAAPAPQVGDLPGNRLRANAAARRGAVPPTRADDDEVDADLLAAIQYERRQAMLAVATGIVATAAPVTAAVYAATNHETVALGCAMAGMFAASFALYHALRWFLLMRSDALPKVLF